MKAISQNLNKIFQIDATFLKDLLQMEIDWSWSAEYVCRWIRAQTKPYPGAFFLHKGKKIIIWKATLLKTDVPFIEGKFIQTKTGSVSIKCSDHLVQLNEIEHHNRIYKNEEIADFLSNLGLI